MYCKKKHIKGDDKDPRGSGAASYKHKSTNTNANVKCATYTIRVVWALILICRLIVDTVRRVDNFPLTVP